MESALVVVFEVVVCILCRMPLSNYTVRRQLALWLFYPLVVLQKDLVSNNVNRVKYGARQRKFI